MARRVHAAVLVRADRALDDDSIALGIDARVADRQCVASTEREEDRDEESDPATASRLKA